MSWTICDYTHTDWPSAVAACGALKPFGHASSGKIGQAVLELVAILAFASILESVTCRQIEAVEGSNPSLSARNLASFQ